MLLILFKIALCCVVAIALHDVILCTLAVILMPLFLVLPFKYKLFFYKKSVHKYDCIFSDAIAQKCLTLGTFKEINDNYLYTEIDGKIYIFYVRHGSPLYGCLMGTPDRSEVAHSERVMDEIGRLPSYIPYPVSYKSALQLYKIKQDFIEKREDVMRGLVL